MNKPLKIISFVTIIACTAALLFTLQRLYVSSPEQEHQHPQPADSKPATISMKNITLRKREKHKDYELIISAQESLFYRESDTISCKDITCNITHSGNTVANIHAERSTIDQKKKIILFPGIAHGKVRNLFIEGKDFMYNFSDQIITTDQTVTYTHPLFTLSAQHSTISITEQTIHMDKGVYSEISYNATANNGG